MMRPLSCSLLLLALPLCAQHRSILFIGNSYTSVNDLPNTLRQLALSLGDTLEVEASDPGGYTFEQHYEYAPTQAAIAERPWDFVVLQEQSQVPSFPPGLALTESIGSARLLVQRIKEDHECALPVFYMTWGRENGDTDNCADWPPVCTYDGMQALLRERYLEMAFANHGCVAPVGVAWAQVRAAAPSIDLYADDGSHPTVAGTYLAACVFYSTLFHTSCEGAPYIASLPQATASLLQTIASNTVLDSADVWMLDVSTGLSADLLWLSTDHPDTYTFHHPGHGQFQWICSDGETSTDPEPSFVLAPGDYTMTLVYTDLCGISDTAVWPFTAWHEQQLGIDPAAATDQFTVSAPASNTVEITGGKGRGTFALFDLQGRIVRTATLATGHILLPCPSGPYVWRISTPDAGTCAGKVFVE